MVGVRFQDVSDSNNNQCGFYQGQVQSGGGWLHGDLSGEVRQACDLVIFHSFNAGTRCAQHVRSETPAPPPTIHPSPHWSDPKMINLTRAKIATQGCTSRNLT